MTNNIVHKALCFAYESCLGKNKKYTYDPYIFHPINVSTMIRDRGFGNDAIAAALLHDLVEYTDTEIDDIYIKFGKVIGDLVKEVTDKNVFVGMTKKEQEDLYLNHLSKASYVGKSIKLASLIDSTKDIIKYDEDFVKFYLPECENLLEVLADGDPIFLKDIKWTFFLSKKRLEKRINK